MVARVMELVNATRKAIDSGCGPADPAVREAAEAVAILLSLVAPYTAEEMWERLGHEPTVARAGWPAVDEALLVEESVTAVVQVQGKVRARLEVSPGHLRGRPGGSWRWPTPAVRAGDRRARGAQGDRARAEAGQRRRLSVGRLASARMPVAIVTDSTASLPPEVAAERGIVVVPLQVVIGATSYDEGADGATPGRWSRRRCKEWRPVSTSRPAPAALLEVYETAARDGADRDRVGPPVRRDERDLRVGAAGRPRRSVPVTAGRHPAGRRRRPGYAALAAADVLDARRHRRGGGRRRRGRGPRRLVAVLRRHPGVPAPRRPDRRRGRAARRGAGGEAAAADRGRQGRPAGEGAHAGRALARLEELAVQAAGEPQVDVCVAHLASPERAGAARRAASPSRLADNLGGREVWCGELGAVLGAHVGPGMLAVCVAPRP